jgi:hypothetical protein
VCPLAALGLVFLLSLLAGCGTNPRDRFTHVHDTTMGCGVARYAKSVAVASVEWTGGCQDTLADGQGVLTLRMSDGRVERYTGAMSGGRFDGKGVLETTGAEKQDGTFSSGDFIFGKVYRSDGFLTFDGAFTDGSFTSGKLFYRDGYRARSVEVAPAGGPLNYETGAGFLHAEVIGPDGAFAWGWVEGRRYNTQAEFLKAYTAYYERKSAEFRVAQAEREQRNAIADEERKRRDADELRQALAQVPGAVAGAMAAGRPQANQNVSTYTPSPAAAPAPRPAPGLTAPQGPQGPDGRVLPPAGTDRPSAQCVKVRREPKGNFAAYLENHCGYTIEVAWCVAGHDCRYGDWGAANLGTIGAGRDRPIVGARNGGGVYYIACERANSRPTEISAKEYYCAR